MERFELDIAFGRNKIFAKLLGPTPIQLNCRFKKYDSTTGRSQWFFNTYVIGINQITQANNELNDSSFYIRCITREAFDDIRIYKKLKDGSEDKYDYYLGTSENGMISITAFEQGKTILSVLHFEDENISNYTEVMAPVDFNLYDGTLKWPITKGRVMYDNTENQLFYNRFNTQLGNYPTKIFLENRMFKGYFNGGTIINLGSSTIAEALYYDIVIYPRESNTPFTIKCRLRSYYNSGVLTYSYSILCESNQDITDYFEIYKKNAGYYIKLLKPCYIKTTRDEYFVSVIDSIPQDAVNITENIVFNIGSTSFRPNGVAIPLTIGMSFYDKTINKPIWWNGTAWVDATGATV